MPFPEAQRVIYGKNPLDKVICQLRFPPILKIDVEIPVDFQERVREKFPIYSESSELNLDVPADVRGQIPPEMLRLAIQTSRMKNHTFSSEDGSWRINLARNFVALSTTKYHRWEEFKTMLSTPLDSLLTVYAPKYFSRVGLRYVDIIQRSKLGLSDVAWKDLLQTHVLSILSAHDVYENVKLSESKHEIGLSDNESMLRMITGLVADVETGEVCFMIDSDFSNADKTQVESVINRLDFFNSRGSRLIRWCITDRLHNAMEPQNL